MQLRFLDRVVVVRNPLIIYKLPTLVTWGITNKVGDKYLLLLDYDNVDYDVVVEDVKYLQKHFNVGHALVRISSLKNYKDSEVGSYHVFFFYTYDFATVRKLLNHTRCDDAFKDGWKYQSRRFVLRIGNKLDINGNEIIPATLFKELILQKTSRGRIKHACRALIEFFEKFDEIKIKKYFKKVDDSKYLEFIKYVTR